MKEALKYIYIFFTISTAVFFFSYMLYNEDISQSKDLYTLHVIEENSQWIYEINKNDQLLIRQEYIPAVAGKKTFKTKRDAEVIGTLVIDKLYKNSNPTLTISEIMSNNINFN
ncbi:DUF4907 domain-containing protein [Winogradskyella sp.]|uniref:DUF4907 domain-containing protein n=1 Tax=Winogradskyella sp. TaxID=1883156 RepID=UPI003BA9D397